MNAIELIKNDHKVAADLFARFKENEDGDNKALFDAINNELTVHAHIEEDILYPRLEAAGDDDLRKLTLEGIQEHKVVKTLLKEIANLADGSEIFNAKLKVLVEMVEHHVEEEENEMFPLVEDQFDEATLEELGAELEDEKGSFQKADAARG
ncbi:MAG: hemerythrin domain-containing protein [Pyrinomonadaceae bacterium]